MADRMAADGFLKAGYEYIIIDDCWLAKDRAADGQLQADPKRFPGGIKPLADYVSVSAVFTLLYNQWGGPPHNFCWPPRWILSKLPPRCYLYPTDG